MKDRCLSSDNPSFKNYGGRGIKVCDRWLVFQKFFEDMGPRPAGTSLERKGNNGHYEPGNCVWATQAKQARNRRNNRYVVYRDREYVLADLADEFDLPPATLARRLRLGWPVDKAVATPAGFQPNSKMLTHNGRTMCVADWARLVGLDATTLGRRIKSGMSVIEAISTPLSEDRAPIEITYKGRAQRLDEWAAELGMPIDRLRSRLNRGWSVERAFTAPRNAPKSTTRWVEIDGDRLPLMEAARRIGISKTNLAYRLDNGIDPRSPTQPRRKYTHNGFTLSIGEWSKRLGIPVPTLYDRLARGWTVPEVFSPATLQGRRPRRSGATPTKTKDTDDGG